MKERELRGIVLKELYDHRRRQGVDLATIATNLPANDVQRALHQLEEQGLINWTFKNLSTGFGSADITALGADVVEGGAQTSLSISFVDNRIDARGSQGVMVNSPGATQTVTVNAEKLLNAIDHAQATDTEKAEAKGLIQRVLDNPLAKNALDWLLKGQTGGI